MFMKTVKPNSSRKDRRLVPRGAAPRRDKSPRGNRAVPFICLIGAFWAAGTLLVGGAARNLTAQEVGAGQHGAAAEAAQIEMLEGLQTESEVAGVIPLGINEAYWNRFIPEDARPTGNDAVDAARIALGKKLYFEPKLSIDGTVSCATCHDVTRGFGDARPTSEGVDKDGAKQFGTRNAPTTMNVATYHFMFWDGRSPSVEHQAMQPIVNPVEMGMPIDEATIIAGIKDDPEYQRLFREAYGAEVNYKNAGDAIAAFERTLIFLDNPFFKYLRTGEFNDGFGPYELAGWNLFNREGRCAACHQMNPTNLLGTDNKFHNIGVAALHQNFESMAAEALKRLNEDSSDAALDEMALTTDLGELGRFVVTKNPADIGTFRTPMLLNVGITGPYMHDGSMATLWDVIDHYNKGGEANRYLDGGIEPLNLTDEQVSQLVAFLFSLTDSRFACQNKAEFQKQQAAAAQSRSHRNPALAERKTLTFEAYKAAPGNAEAHNEQSQKGGAE